MSRQMNNFYLDSNFSRREFLRFFSLGLAGLILPRDMVSHLSASTERQGTNTLFGRITKSGHELRKLPNEGGDVVKELTLDSLYRITGVRINNRKDVPNPIWYELDGVGYAHSRRIQLVKKNPNHAVMAIPEKGCLGEITMPFVDAYSSIGANRSIVYRFYYSSTFWILDSLVDEHNSVWYQLLDDRTYQRYYVPAYSVRLVPDTELTPISPEVPPEDKKLVVDLSTQSLTAYEKDQVIFMTKISSGVRLLEGGFATPKGHYRITRKRPCRHMANPPNAYGSGFDLPGVPWVSYFTSDGVAFHGAYWHNDFGVPHSHGCINMDPQAAKWTYRWTTPTVPPENYYFSDTNGTRIIIQ